MPSQEDRLEKFKAEYRPALRSYGQCVFKAAGEFANITEPPETIAVAARGSCLKEEANLSIIVADETQMSRLRQTMREQAILFVVQYRQKRATQPKQNAPVTPSRPIELEA